jgi:hypothetical protein
VPTKGLGLSEKLNICLPEIDTPLKSSFSEKGFYIANWYGISPLLYKNFSFGSHLTKSKSIALSKPVKWKRTCQEKPSK